MRLSTIFPSANHDTFVGNKRDIIGTSHALEQEDEAGPSESTISGTHASSVSTGCPVVQASPLAQQPYLFLHLIWNSHLSFTYFNYWVNWQCSYSGILIFFEETDFLKKKLPNHHLVSVPLKMGAVFLYWSKVCTCSEKRKVWITQSIVSKKHMGFIKNISHFYHIFQ